MSYISHNLKFLRKSKGMTQQALADALFLNRPVIGAYEEGRAEPKLETLKKISELFNIHLESLWSVELAKVGKVSNIPITPYFNLNENNQSLKVLSITVDSLGNENIEWVPNKASAGYLNGYADPEYMATLPKFQLPILKGGTFRAFEIKGDSMLPLESGTFIVGEFLEDWRFIQEGLTYIVVTKTEGIVYKRVFRVKNSNLLSLVSDNSDYQPYFMEIENILEIWKSKAFIGTRFPEPKPINTFEKISEMLGEIKKSVDHFKK